MPPSVAIIMRAKNEMPHVHKALEALTQQSCSSFDLFAVDSGSSDGTLEALQESGASLKQIAPEEYIPGNVLNNAITQTNHELIVLLNADAIPQSKQWLENLIAPIMENKADATFSKQVARPDARFIVTYDYERAYNTSKADPGFFSAVACAFKRSLWENNGFPTNGYAEDLAWAERCRAEGARFLLVENSVVEHSHNYTLKELHKKRFRQAITFHDTPNRARQFCLCLREIARDFLHAIAKFKLHTIPYNVAYRINIHRAIYEGLKAE
jgi:rhamnosyltransferase